MRWLIVVSLLSGCLSDTILYHCVVTRTCDSVVTVRMEDVCDQGDHEVIHEWDLAQVDACVALGGRCQCESYCPADTAEVISCQ